MGGLPGAAAWTHPEISAGVQWLHLRDVGIWRAQRWCGVTRCPSIGPGCSHGSWPYRDAVGVGGRGSSGARDPFSAPKEGRQDFKKGVSKEAGAPKYL